jgi:hypothetical protein
MDKQFHDMDTCANVIKLFTAPQFMNVLNKLECLSLGKPFQPTLMLAGKAMILS